MPSGSYTMSEADRTYVRVALYIAIGALKAVHRDDSRMGEIIRQLESSAEKIDAAKAN